MRCLTILRRAWPAWVLLLLLGGCGDDDATSTADLSTAWSEFEQGDWAAADEAFLAALAQTPSSAEAWCGLGWSRAARHAQGGSGDLREGVLDALAEADRLRGGYVDAWAGLAEFHNALNDTLPALEWALDAAEAGGPGYQFQHQAGVNHRSLRKIAAWSLFKLGRYAEAGSQVALVLPGFSYAGRADSLEVLLEGIGGL